MSRLSASLTHAPISASQYLRDDGLFHGTSAGLHGLQRDVAELSRLEASASRGLSELVAEVALIQQDPVAVVSPTHSPLPTQASGSLSPLPGLSKAFVQDWLADVDDMLCAEAATGSTAGSCSRSAGPPAVVAVDLPTAAADEPSASLANQAWEEVGQQPCTSGEQQGLSENPISDQTSPLLRVESASQQADADSEKESNQALATAIAEAMRLEFDERHCQQQQRLNEFMHQAEVSLKALVAEVASLLQSRKQPCARNINDREDLVVSSREELEQALRREFEEQLSQQQAIFDSSIARVDDELQAITAESRRDPEPELHREVDERSMEVQSRGSLCDRARDDLENRIAALEKEVSALRDSAGERTVDSDLGNFRPDVALQDLQLKFRKLGESLAAVESHSEKSCCNIQASGEVLRQDVLNQMRTFRKDLQAVAAKDLSSVYAKVSIASAISNSQTEQVWADCKASLQYLQGKLIKLQSDVHASAELLSTDIQTLAAALRRELGDAVSTLRCELGATLTREQVHACAEESVAEALLGPWRSDPCHGPTELQSKVDRISCDLKEQVDSIHEELRTFAAASNQQAELQSKLGHIPCDLNEQVDSLHEKLRPLATISSQQEATRSDVNNVREELSAVSSTLQEEALQVRGSLAASSTELCDLRKELGTFSEKLQEEVVHINSDLDVMADAVRTQVGAVYEDLHRESNSLHAGLCAQSAEMHVQVLHGHFLAESQARALAYEAAHEEAHQWGRRAESQQADEIQRKLAEVLPSALRAEMFKEAAAREKTERESLSQDYWNGLRPTALECQDTETEAPSREAAVCEASATSAPLDPKENAVSGRPSPASLWRQVSSMVKGPALGSELDATARLQEPPVVVVHSPSGNSSRGDLDSPPSSHGTPRSGEVAGHRRTLSNGEPRRISKSGPQTPTDKYKSSADSPTPTAATQASSPLGPGWSEQAAVPTQSVGAVRSGAMASVASPPLPDSQSGAAKSQSGSASQPMFSTGALGAAPKASATSSIAMSLPMSQRSTEPTAITRPAGAAGTSPLWTASSPNALPGFAAQQAAPRPPGVGNAGSVPTQWQAMRSSRRSF